jgi:hypothetical protein
VLCAPTLTAIALCSNLSLELAGSLRLLDARPGR